MAINRVINYLWYLSEECADSIFDKRIIDEKRKNMAPITGQRKTKS